jgi:hypothetical protein
VLVDGLRQSSGVGVSPHRDAQSSGKKWMNYDLAIWSCCNFKAWHTIIKLCIAFFFRIFFSPYCPLLFVLGDWCLNRKGGLGDSGLIMRVNGLIFYCVSEYVDVHPSQRAKITFEEASIQFISVAPPLLHFRVSFWW